MKRWAFYAGGITVLSLLAGLFVRSVSDDKENEAKEFREKYNVFSFPLPDNISFAGEKIPMELFDVRERVDRELLVNVYWQSQTILFFKRAGRWFPVIEPILKKNNVPDDFKYIALIESGFMNVTSPSGAVGYWQFLETTGKLYGLEITEEVDERYHVEKSTEAACRYFREAKEKLNSWTLAAASYNMGITGVKKQIEKQNVKTYYDLLLNEETFRYVFRAIAMKEIMTNPLRYGYHLKLQDLYHPFTFTETTVDSTISNLVDFAAASQINYKNLKLLNPWLRQNTLTNKTRKTYSIKILQPQPDTDR